MPTNKSSSMLFSPNPRNFKINFPRRSSIGIKDGVGLSRDSMDDKENRKYQILKPVKVNESPRKKVLVERNEAAPCFADPKSHVGKVTFAKPLEEKKLDPFFDDEIIPKFEEGPRSSLTSKDSNGESETSVCYMNVLWKKASKRETVTSQFL
ncbi:hypothetical protein RJT34_28260 [Clitoria ternatea]|uniref:Uncharacterized protein n=1 Tax=Clitoria ternatea TaxID=43366 RepID=A0AAN9I8Y1_CLITE